MDDSFSVVILPDTQNYSQFYPAIFTSQTQWIVDNQAALNIQMVIGVGDIVNHAESTTEWNNATAAANLLDGKVPYAFAIGNHDYANVKPTSRDATMFNKYFGPARYAAYSWYGGNYQASNENFYTFFTVNGQKYMLLALEFYPRNDVLTWASSLIDSNPDAKVMVVTHSFVFTDGTRVDLCDTNDMSASEGNSGQVVWQKLLEKKPNVILVTSGHLVSTRTAHRTDLGANGNIVNEIFTNFQDDANGGNGYLRILTYHPSADRIDVKTYSPYLNLYRTSSEYQFSLPINNDGNTATLGAISGKVRSSSCTPIPGAQVSTAGVTATTASTGLYTLPGLTPNGEGGYSLSVTANGYDSDTGSGTAIAGFSDQGDFYLMESSSPTCSLNTADPSVTICTPAGGATVAAPVTVSAGVTSSKAIQYVQVYLDGLKQQTFYTRNLSTTVVAPAGAHRLTIQFKDSAGVITKSSTNFTVGATAPSTTVNISSPTSGASPTSPVHVAASTTSSVTINTMQVYVDNVQQYQIAGSTVSTDLTMSTGPHTIKVEATDSNGVSTSSTVSITVSSPTPVGTTVTINSPANNATVTSPVNIVATVTSDKTITYMQVYVDGVNKYTVYSKNVNTSLTMTAGAHRVTVQAKDSTGVFTKSTINITVR